MLDQDNLAWKTLGKDMIVLTSFLTRARMVDLRMKRKANTRHA
jgi:hypothetical protein